MLRKTLIALTLAVAALQASAAPATAESIERLLTLTKSESIMDTMYSSMEQVMQQSMKQVVAGRQLSPQQQQVMDKLPAKFVAVMREEFNWANMKPHYVRIYQESFEQEEVDGLIAFYQSPAGQAMVNKMPLVLQKSMSLAQDQMRTLMPKMNRVMEEAIKEALAK